MAASPSLHVVVIGAGPSGLLLAHGLQAAGIKVTIFEREDESRYLTRPRDWSMSIHWGEEYLNSLLPEHRKPELHENIAANPGYTGKFTGLPIYNTKTGEHLLDIPDSSKLIRVSRTKLRKYLSEGVDVHYGKELSSLRRDEATGLVTAEFADGTSATADLVAGCDGARSKTRHLLLGKDAAALKTMDYHMLNIVLTYPRDVALHLREIEPVFRIAYHPNNHMSLLSVQDTPDSRDPETWLFQSFLSWPEAPRASDLPDSASRVKYWKKHAEQCAEPWKTVINNMPDDYNVPIDQVAYWEPSVDWSNTPLQHQVTLIGDAAHPAPPFRGQGLNLGMQDAAVLVQQLKEVKAGKISLSDAVIAYEEDMRERAILEVHITKAQTEMIHNFAVMMDSPMIKMGMGKAKEVKERTRAAEAAAESNTSGTQTANGIDKASV